MKFLKFLTVIILIVSTSNADDSPDPTTIAKEMLEEIIETNLVFKKEKSIEDFEPFMHGQTPRATVVMCSDSRTQTDAFHEDATNHLFLVRNIGNQFETAQGSIEYGVLHLHTPLLIFIGHSACGAVKAAQGDYSQKTPALKAELDGLQVKNIKDGNLAIIENTNHQVDYAMARFNQLVTERSLTVVGAIYDFVGSFGQGVGALIIININGETDPKKLQCLDILKGIKSAKIGVRKL